LDDAKVFQELAALEELATDFLAPVPRYDDTPHAHTAAMSAEGVMVFAVLGPPCIRSDTGTEVERV
jgi:hypothetical protein